MKTIEGSNAKKKKKKKYDVTPLYQILGKAEIMFKRSFKITPWRVSIFTAIV
jgi:hypothetical protein